MRPTAPADTAETSPANDASNLAGRAGIQSVEVGFTLLSVLAKSPQAMMLRDLAHAADMSSAKAHRYLVSFQRLGLVSQDPLSNRYDLGPASLRIGLAGLSRSDPVRSARAAITDWSAQIGHTMALAVWGNQGPTMVHWHDGGAAAAAKLRLGDVMPLLSSATGRCFLSYMAHRHPDHPACERMLQRELAAVAHHPQSDIPKDPEAVAALISETRQHGVARVVGSLIPGISGLCAPVFDSQGQLTMGLVTLGASGVFDADWNGETAATLRAFATQLSHDLGCPDTALR